MAVAVAAPGFYWAPPQPWHDRLQAHLCFLERAAEALLLVCEEPQARAALEVRARAMHVGGAQRRDCAPWPSHTPVRFSATLSLIPRPRGCAQARNVGFASAAVLAQLEAVPLMQRLDLASDQVLRARGTLAPRADAASGAGGARHGMIGFASLPHAVALHIFSFVPADARARAALVCRAWRDTVIDPRLWTVLDLSRASGMPWNVPDATLRGAAALARGGLTALCLHDCRAVTQAARLEVVTANAGSLRELSCSYESDDDFVDEADVTELAGAAPQLVVFKADVRADVRAHVAVATRALRREPPFGALHVRKLTVVAERDVPGQADLLAFWSAVSGHASLNVLQVFDTRLDSPAVIDALCAAAVACKLLSLRISDCHLSPASVPALVRLIRGGVLESLRIDNDNAPLLSEATAAQLADALAANRTLTRLRVSYTRFWDDAPAAGTMMRALTGHPHLRELDLSDNSPWEAEQSIAGAALGALVAADSPALQVLIVRYAELGDAGLAPLFEALPRNSHLRELQCCFTGPSEAFARDVALPAVRANTSLRELCGNQDWVFVKQDGEAPPEWLEAEALVAARR